MSFDKCIQSYNHTRIMMQDFSISPKSFPVSLCRQSFLSYPFTLGNPDHFSLASVEFHINGIICVWLLALNISLSRASLPLMYPYAFLLVAEQYFVV